MARDMGPGERIFTAINYAFLALLGLLCLYPFWYGVVIALNDGLDAGAGGLWLWPRVFTLENIRVVLLEGSTMRAFWISVGRTALGATLGVFFTGMVAWSISRRELVGRKWIITFFFITMLFNGGLIPFYLLLHELNLISTFWVYVVPYLFNAWNLIIMQTAYRQIPEELIESAKLDGANDLYIFLRIGIPLSAPMLATLFLFTAVWHWNDWFSGAFYNMRAELRPLATHLQILIMQSQANLRAVSGMANMGEAARESLRGVTTISVRMATLVISTLPILIVYPFLQRHFVKGALVGSLKE